MREGVAVNGQQVLRPQRQRSSVMTASAEIPTAKAGTSWAASHAGVGYGNTRLDSDANALSPTTSVRAAHFTRPFSR